MFDLLGWRWDYEPLDLHGYIPDFILRFPRADVLAEVKPVMHYRHLDLPETEKIDRTWGEHKMEAVVFGGSHDVFIMRERGDDSGDSKFGWGFGWGEARIFRCKGHVGIEHTDGYHGCRYCGAYTEDFVTQELNLEPMWAEAHNKTAWRGSDA